jgi:hypothetical protein
MTMSGADSEAAAFLGMTRNLCDALIERNHVVRPYKERYERLQDDPRTVPEKRVKAAAHFLQAAYSADHIYRERVEEGLEEYRRMIAGGEESRQCR